MVHTSSTNFVDRLLMKLDGAIAPIWNRLFLTIDHSIDGPILLRCFQQLIEEIPRLRSQWNLKSQRWDERSYATVQSLIKLSYDREIFSKEDRIKQVLVNSKPMENGLPIRLHFAAIQDANQPSFLLTLELHHGAGDGHSVLLIIKRFWQILDHVLYDNTLTRATIKPPELTDKLVMKHVLKKPRHILKLMNNESRQFARRGSSLKHQATQIGSPTLLSIRVNDIRLNNHKPSSLFYAAILAAIIQLEDKQEHKNIRIRIPVDVRQVFNLSYESIGNACSAMIVEFGLHELRTLFYDQAQELIPTVEAKLKKELKSYVYLTNALECVLVSRLATKASLHQAAPKELLADQRSCSLVITFAELTQFITPPSPINLLDVSSHTPVWGLNGYLCNGHMYINLCCFDGIWPQDIQKQFKHYIVNFLTTNSAMEEATA